MPKISLIPRGVAGAEAAVMARRGPVPYTRPPVKYHALRIQRIVDETADTRSFVLEIPPDLAGEFAYRAGQFLTFRVVQDGVDRIRCYSLASSPETESEHKVTVKRVDEGRVSNWFNDHLAVGDTVDVLKPSGRFVLHEAEGPLLLFAGGSGITPVIGILKTALATTPRGIRMLYANRDEASIIFRDELDALVAAHPGRLELHHHLDDASGFVGPGTLGALAEGLASPDCYVCGPGPFMDVVEAVLAARGIDSGRIFIERFESPADGEAPQVVLSADAEIPSEIVVHLGGQTHHVPYAKGQRILAAVRAAGLEAPFACEEGYCGSCAAKRIQGDVQMATNDVFEDEEVAQGWCLTCQGVAVGGRCEISYDS
jgi:3-ketosteroid 9alpha-monooxygenase subunit B